MKTRAGGLHGGKQPVPVGGVFMVHAVGNHFRIGLRFKHIAQALQAGAFFLKIFDDAVVHHRNQAT